MDWNVVNVNRAECEQYTEWNATYAEWNGMDCELERECGSNTDQTTHMVGTCESLYSANTSLGAPTITMDLARISVTPSLNLQEHALCIRT